MVSFLFFSANITSPIMGNSPVVKGVTMNEIFNYEEMKVVITIDDSCEGFVTLMLENTYSGSLEVRLSVSDSMKLRHMLECGEKMVEAMNK